MHDKAARTHRAVSAARAVAFRYGIRADKARVLHDANNIVVHLAPSPVVAKVCPSATTRGMQKLGAEMAIARHLVGAGAPVVGPSSELPAGPHVYCDHAITFWRYHDHDPEAAVSVCEAGNTLAQVHMALDAHPGLLRSFLDMQVKRAGDLLAGATSLPMLKVGTRAFLRGEYASITSQLHSRNLRCRALHGDPHRGNFLVGPTGCLMIDFESVCSGPLEWDLSAIPGGGAGLFDVEEDLLQLLRRLRSLCVAVWCWTRSDRSSAFERAAMDHFDLLRRAA